MAIAARMGDLPTRHVQRSIEIKEEILAGLREAGLAWELREGAWSVEGIFDQEPVQTVRVQNPFGPISRDVGITVKPTFWLQ